MFKAGTGHCVIDKARRNWCPFCRLQRCFEARMNVTAVQDERGPRKPKRNLLTIKNKTKSDSPSPPHTFNDDLHYQILAQILVACIRQAKNNENLRPFCRTQKETILRNVWTECFILRASHWSIDISTIISR